MGLVAAAAFAVAFGQFAHRDEGADLIRAFFDRPDLQLVSLGTQSSSGKGITGYKTVDGSGSFDVDMQRHLLVYATFTPRPAEGDIGHDEALQIAEDFLGARIPHFDQLKLTSDRRLDDGQGPEYKFDWWQMVGSQQIIAPPHVGVVVQAATGTVIAFSYFASPGPTKPGVELTIRLKQGVGRIKEGSEPTTLLSPTVAFRVARR
jgi:hypothetical protein